MVGGDKNWELISRTGGFSRGGTASATCNPFVTETLVSQIDKPQFSGRKSDWAAFRVRWEHYLKTFHTLMAGGLEDPMVLTLLGQSLDKYARRQLEGAIEINRHLTYSQF